ncbi:MAG: hypothetical protein ACI88A_000682 [Paraglaciecola sp.]|jgi:hypothetical protein
MKAAKNLKKVRRQAWLASIGAFDKGRELAVDKFDELIVNSSSFVNNMLSKGESLEDELQAKLGARNMLEEKIAALRAKLGMSSVSRDQQLETLSNKVDSLIEVVAKLAQQRVAAKPATKSVAKPAAKSAAKPAAKSAAKPAAKSAAKPATKSAAKPAAKSAAKPAAKPTAKPAVKAVVKPAVKPVEKPAVKPAEVKKD